MPTTPYEHARPRSYTTASAVAFVTWIGAGIGTLHMAAEVLIGEPSSWAVLALATGIALLAGASAALRLGRLRGAGRDAPAHPRRDVIARS